MVVMHEDGTCVDIPLGGAPLGMMSGMEFPDHQVSLQPGDVCLVYSDGITEQTNAAGKMYQEKRLLKALRGLRHETPEAIVQGIRESVLKFAGNTPAGDDFTIVALRWNPAS